MVRSEINPVLLDMAAWKLHGDNEKAAFVPTDPAAAGGAPPMDPMAAGGGAPPPPMDPMAAMGGAPPPMDPMAAMGGAPPAPAPAPAAPGMAPMAPGAAPGQAAKPKIDPTFIYMELARVRKLLTHMMQNTGIDLPPDILDDGAVAQQLTGTPPDSPAIGQEGGAAPAGPAPLPAMGGSPAIAPIEAPGAGPGGPAEKQGGLMSLFKDPVAEDAKPDFGKLENRIDALAELSRRRGG